MLFNSFEYLLLFLPLTFFLYFLCNHLGYNRGGLYLLILSSLLFYSYWHPSDLLLLAISIIFNFFIGGALLKSNEHKKSILIFGLATNLLFLGYYKYGAFFALLINSGLGISLPLPTAILPLAISFFTFQQIAYLIDCYNKEVEVYELPHYTLFIAFFPQLIAGPIVHHKEMMPQFSTEKAKKIHLENIALGLFLFSLGLFKKVAIADSLSNWVAAGFDRAETLSLFDGWLTSFSYTLQLYFDFSGYTDMALGGALLFNIKLPQNFNSPYKADSIQEFWKRWHMTLSRFLKDYIYIPLGGNRKGSLRTYINLILTFLIGGIWHGAGWLFILWGLLHGVALAFQRFWQKTNISLPKTLSWFLTFHFINISWVFFRAREWNDAIKILRSMFGFDGLGLPTCLIDTFPLLSSFGIIGKDSIFLGTPGEFQLKVLLKLLFFLGLALFCKNSREMTERFKMKWQTAILAAFFWVYGLLSFGNSTEFLYFQF